MGFPENMQKENEELFMDIKLHFKGGKNVQS